MMVTLKALKQLGMTPDSCRVVIQGFGNVGGMAARLMSAVGFKIVGIIEYNGAVYNPHGLDIAALQKHRKETGFLTGFSGAEDMDLQDALFTECDVLIPAATENVIHSGNADRIRCKILCEGANGPTTPPGRPHSGGQEGLRDPRHPGQCRRRHRFVFRMGAGSPGLLLEREAGE